MKNVFKRIITTAAAALAAVMCLAVNVCAYSAGIDDQAGLFTAEQKAALEERQEELADYTGWNIAVVTTNVGFGTDGYNAIEYAESYYKDTFGSYSADGILYLIDIDYRHFAVGGVADTDYFNDKRIKKMFNACNERYMDYDDVGNVETFYDYVEKYYNEGHFSNFSFSFGAAIIVGLIAMGIGIGAVVSRYKFHYQPTANNYLDGTKVNFYRRQDRFIREFTTRTKISSESSGGGSGGGHGSSGGHSMGGGGGGGRR